MKLLLDTQIALWAWAEPERIPPEVKTAMTDEGNEVYFSQVATWEIQIKYALGKLPLPEKPEKFLPKAISRAGFQYLPIQDRAIFFLGQLPDFHRDPFDRLFIAHSITGNFTLATSDPSVMKYPVLYVS